MSKIDELLMNEEVEWKKLWEVTIWDKKFKGVDKFKQNKINKYHYYFSNELNKLSSDEGTIKILTTNKTELYAIEESVKNNISEGEIVCIPGGGNAIVQYYNGKFITSDNRIATSLDTNKLNNKFLYYFLLNKIDLIASFYRGSGIKHPDMCKVLELEIPIPSIETQEKIVKTLDKFTNYVTELQAELQARTKQYEYYRDFLLSEEYLNKLSEQIYDFTKEKYELKITTLGNIAKVNRGASPRPISKYITDDDTGVPWIKIGDIGLNSKYVTKTKQKITVEGAKNSRVLNKGDFIMSNSMSYGRPYILDIVGAIHDGWASISDFDKFLDSDFLYYYLTTTKVQNYWNSKINSSSVSNLNSEIIRSLPIPLVDKRLQKNIVIILDKFQLLLSDTKGLLPQEIEQRQKQYEYYREKLLTFDVECGSKQASKQASKS